ncbi:hypothetical protein Q9966_016509 [Columba livia]|nr:hypothetical protein Q9966_016509 [Columba livia]
MEERGGGSPRFGKLHFPVGLWINSPKKRLAKMSSRWPSAASVRSDPFLPLRPQNPAPYPPVTPPTHRSTSSDTASRGSEPPDPRPPQKPKPPRHKRLSNLFHRGWASEKKLAELIEPLGAGTEKIKEIGERQPELELLNLAQRSVVNMEKEMEMEGPSPEVTSDLDTCDEAMATLDEVVMSTFQQCVYYLTKSLYATLPALLESNPFSGAGEPSAGGGPDLGGVPEGLRPTLGLFRVTLRLSHECHLHPDLASQTFGYLFFFCNASLFNTLMEKGGEGVPMGPGVTDL